MRRQGRRPRRWLAGMSRLQQKIYEDSLDEVALAGSCAVVVALARCRSSSTRRPRPLEAGIRDRDRVTDATLNPDGSMDVVEALTYDFTPSATAASATFEPGGRRLPTILDFGAEDGDPRPADRDRERRTGSDRRAAPRLRALGRRRTSRSRAATTTNCSYHVDDAVARRHPTSAVLVLAVRRHGVPASDHVDVTIHTPGDGTGLRVFVHGALNGVVVTEGNDVHLGRDRQPGGHEGRGAAARAAVDFTVPPTGPALDQILADEAGLADKANAATSRAARRTPSVRRTSKTAGNIASPVLAILGIVAFTAIFLKWGKEPTPSGRHRRLLARHPDEPPGGRASARDCGRCRREGFSATLVDLAQRGWLTITEEHSETAILRRDKSTIASRARRRPTARSPTTRPSCCGACSRRPATITQDELVDEAKSDRRARPRRG